MDDDQRGQLACEEDIGAAVERTDSSDVATDRHALIRKEASDGDCSSSKDNSDGDLSTRTLERTRSRVDDIRMQASSEIGRDDGREGDVEGVRSEHDDGYLSCYE